MPVAVRAGAGCLATLPSLVVPGAWLLVTTAGFTARGATARVRDLLEAGGAGVRILDAVQPNPELDDLAAWADSLRGQPVRGIVALGGGSVLDAAKVLSVLLPADPGSLSAALRDGCRATWKRSARLVAIPTTAGTGAEATPFATVWDSVQGRKHSLSDAALFPDHCLLDPELTLALPRTPTLHGGLDTTSHALESLWNRNRTPLTRIHALAALEQLVPALPAVLRDPTDLAARESMQLASLLAGMAISHTRTAVAHSISYPLTLRHGVPHGLACSFTLAALLRRHRHELAADAREASLLEATLAMLETLDLPRELARYVSPEAVLSLLPEMDTPDRSGNFRFEVDIESLLAAALAPGTAAADGSR